MRKKIIYRRESDGYRVMAYDGVEFWDVDGPFATESEAHASLHCHIKDWLQSHPDDADLYGAE